jgi:hypothetical protein
MANQRQESAPPKRLGIFYPRGYVVVDTERLLNVARRIGYVKAQKYDRFSVTEL